jgi:hypothetical protein
LSRELCFAHFATSLCKALARPLLWPERSAVRSNDVEVAGDLHTRVDLHVERAFLRLSKRSQCALHVTSRGGTEVMHPVHRSIAWGSCLLAKLLSLVRERIPVSISVSRLHSSTQVMFKAQHDLCFTIVSGVAFLCGG